MGGLLSSEHHCLAQANGRLLEHHHANVPCESQHPLEGFRRNVKAGLGNKKAGIGFQAGTHLGEEALRIRDFMDYGKGERKIHFGVNPESVRVSRVDSESALPCRIFPHVFGAHRASLAECRQQ
jgi:hypothetical protein